ncbi:50S ribosomal protein L6 [bacterium]|nr:50S ribosomal protein L6 [bacterium]MBU1937547.1 50S ribosomal protein L6 [bacterium]
MSRIGRKVIPVPEKVNVAISGTHVKVEGPLGEIERTFHTDMEIVSEGKELLVRRPSDTKMHKSLHGLTRALLWNMVIGVSQGFKKELEIVGVGYRAEAKKLGILLSIGFSHGIFFVTPQNIKIEVPKPTSIVISGVDRELVGEVAAQIRSIRKPEPYKGKGIRYVGEHVHRKAGKTAK